MWVVIIIQTWPYNTDFNCFLVGNPCQQQWLTVVRTSAGSFKNASSKWPSSGTGDSTKLATCKKSLLDFSSLELHQ
jgi:hypothetical protein